MAAYAWRKYIALAGSISARTLISVSRDIRGLRGALLNSHVARSRSKS